MCLRRGRLERAENLVLEPDLPMASIRVVLQQPERRCRHLPEMFVERRQHPGELLPLVEPETDLCPLLVLEALDELAHEDLEEHHTTLAIRRTSAFCMGSMFTFTPSSRSGSQPLGR